MKKRMSSQSGQIAVEAVLIGVVIVSIALAVSKNFRSNGVLAKLVEGPWAYVDGMARHGVWAPAQNAAALDPNFSPRRASREAEFDR
jgi:hypothetical protein